MEELKETLTKLLLQEISNLELGHPYNKTRISMMKEICHILTYYTYVDMSDDDMLRIVKLYDF